MTESRTDQNGRVTNAILATKLDALTDMVRRQLEEADKREMRLATLERCEAVNQQRWQSHGELHTRERGLLGVGSFVGSLIAGAIGVFVDRP